MEATAGNDRAPSPLKGREIWWILLGFLVLLMAAAIVIPYFLRTQYMELHEATGAVIVRTLITAEIMYQSTYFRYTPDLVALGGTAEQCQQPNGAHSCLVDQTTTTSSPTRPKSRYYFGAKLGPSKDTFLVWGVPVVFPNKSYCGVEDGVIRFDASGSTSSVTTYAGCKALPQLLGER